MKKMLATCDRCGKSIPQLGEKGYESFGTFMQHRFNSTPERVGFVKGMERNFVWLGLDPGSERLDLCNDCKLSLYIWIKEGQRD